MSEPDPAGSVDRASAEPRTDSRGLSGVALALCALSIAAAFAALGWLPGWSLPLCAGPALCATAALPLIVRWSPLPPDLLKLTAFTFALSPFLAASVFGAWHVLLDARAALAACAASFALLHLATLRTRVRIARTSSAQHVICVVALALAVGIGCVLLRGNEPRFLEPALTRAAVALSVDRSLPPLHPWLAGEAWSHVWSADLLAAFTMRALNIAPTFARALFLVQAALLAPIFLYFLASSIWNDSRRSAVSVMIALFASLLAFKSGVSIPIALAPFMIAGSAALALTLSLAALGCASHALRHGKRPWIGLCALLHGFALCFDFANAWPAALATLLACLAPTCSAYARPRLLLALMIAGMPGLIQARVLARAEMLPVADSISTLLVGLSVWIAIAAVASLVAWRVIERERRAALVLCLIAAAVAVSSAIFAPGWTDERGALSLALFTLAIPTASLIPSNKFAWRPRVSAGVFACGALVLFGMWELARTCAPLLDASRRNDALLGETSGALEPVSHEASAVDLRAALAALRTDARLASDKAVLLACPANNPYRKTRDLPERALPACAGIALYGDTRSKDTQGEAQFQPRLEELLQLFRDEAAFDPTLIPRLEHIGARAVVALVRDEDIAINPALVGKFERLGFRHWRDFGGVRLYIGPLAAAQRYLGTP